MCPGVPNLAEPAAASSDDRERCWTSTHVGEPCGPYCLLPLAEPAAEHPLSRGEAERDVVAAAIRAAVPDESACVADEEECFRLHPVHLMACSNGVVQAVYADVEAVARLAVDALDLPCRDARVRAQALRDAADSGDSCTVCGEIHVYRRISSPEEVFRGSWSHPRDGHAYRRRQSETATAWLRSLAAAAEPSAMPANEAGPSVGATSDGGNESWLDCEAQVRAQVIADVVALLSDGPRYMDWCRENRSVYSYGTNEVVHAALYVESVMGRAPSVRHEDSTAGDSGTPERKGPSTEAEGRKVPTPGIGHGSALAIDATTEHPEPQEEQ
jgi:hypothetical protein